MNCMNKLGFIALVAASLAPAAHAGYLEVTVDGRSGPWTWTDGGLNGSYAYGPADQDFLAPTVVDLAAIGTGTGGDLFIAYKSGLTNAFGGTPIVDQAGYVGSVFKDDVPGSSGAPFPSIYLSSQWGVNQQFEGSSVSDPENYGVFLQALVGAIADDTGAVLNPFAIGSVIPVSDGTGGYQQGYVTALSFNISNASAASLLLGMNDDIFRDNTGALQVCVASSEADLDTCMGTPSVPEPSTLLLLAGAGLGLPWWRGSRA